MAPPPPAKCPTTVLDLDDGLLCEVFLRLPALPGLVRAALSCRTFLRAVRSSPAFRRRFRELHPSPFVGLFIQRLLKGWEPEAASFDAHHRCPDRDFEAAVRGGDFSLTGLPLPDGDSQECGDGDNMDEDDEDEDEEEDASPVWEIERCCDGYVVLFNRRAQPLAVYDPLTQALHLFPAPPKDFSDAVNYEFHIISSEEDSGVPPRVVCFCSGFFQAVVGVISSDSSAESEWRKFPGTAIGVTGRMVNGSVYWTHVGKPYITVFDTTTLQFTKMDLPPLLAGQKGRECAFVLGNTKDGRPCIVSPDLWGGCSLDVFFWRRDDEDYDDCLNYWILDKSFPLKTIRQFIKFSEGDDEFIILRLMDVIDGIVYLRTEYDGCRGSSAVAILLSRKSGAQNDL
ncbi:hypothetical protein TRIUR3_10034 [Triticum urartu]|uniref:F-box domain-containing protein n=1 Tax=Triticum urartu TaxID=4572 RepID=M7ZUF4_TRIUA|nr:hypothetical protein TRIUR3_10034 [Triticum urartu]